MSANERSKRHMEARRLAALGVPVFPCEENGKRPALTAHGFKEATTDAAMIDWWWQQGDWNIGVCPHAIGQCVVDIDGAEGIEEWRNLTKEQPVQTRTVRTPHGGAHLYFKGELPPTVGTSNRGIAPKIDTRGRGSYVLVPPSIINGVEYQFPNRKGKPEPEPAPLPQWITDKCWTRVDRAKAAVAELDAPANVERAQALLAGLIKASDVAREGQGGNDRTYRLFCELLNFGLSAEKAQELVEAPGGWNDACVPPWSHGELAVLFENAGRYAQNEPGAWGVPPAAETFKGEVLETLKAHSVNAEAARDFAELLDPFGKATIKPELQPDMLPEVIWNFAADEAKRLGVNVITCAMPALVTTAAALDNRIRLQPRDLDTRFTQPAILWAIVNADVSVRKSPAIAGSTQPLRDIHERWHQEDKVAIARFNEAEEHKKQWAKAGVLTAPPQPGESLPLPPEKPIRRKLMIGELTMEGLARELEENPRGMLIAVDEAAGYFAGFDAYRKASGKDITSALELYEGRARSITRADASKDRYVPIWGAGFIGGIQPDTLRKLAPGIALNGFLQRHMIVEGEHLGLGVDAVPDREAIAAYEATVRRIVEVQPWSPPIAVKLDWEGQEYFREVELLADALQGLPTMSEELRGHLGKMTGLFARLALTFHAIESAVSDTKHLEAVVSGETTRRVRDFMVRYLIPAAVKAYAALFHTSDPETELGRDVAGWIIASRKETFTRRDLTRNWPAFTKDPGAVERFSETYTRMGWITGPTPMGRQSSPTWTVNPMVHVRFANRAEEERTRRAEAHAAIKARVARVKTVYGQQDEAAE